MERQHRAIRALLTSMSPRRAEAYIKAFQLREEEENVLFLGDVKGLSHIQIAGELHISPETVKRRKRSAYQKIADDIQHSESLG